jgi:ferritin
MYILLKDMGLAGCATWMLAKSQGKTAQTVELCDYICYRGAKIRLQPIPAPKQDWRAPLHIFEEIIRLEQKSAASLATIYEAAVADKDYPSQHFLMQFISKQMKREMSITKILERLRRMQATDIGVLTFDRELQQMAAEENMPDVDHHNTVDFL